MLTYVWDLELTSSNSEQCVTIIEFKSHMPEQRIYVEAQSDTPLGSLQCATIMDCKVRHVQHDLQDLQLLLRIVLLKNVMS